MVCRYSRIETGDVAVAANLVWLVHMAVIVTVVAAALLPFEGLWWAMLLVAPGMQLQWRLNRNQCLLTDLEAFLRRDESGPGTGDARHGDSTFVARLLSPVVGEVSERAVDVLSTGLLWASFAGCGARLAFA